MKQEKRFRLTGARPSPVHLDLHRRLASVYSMDLPLVVLQSTEASALQTVSVSPGTLSNCLAVTITVGNQNGSMKASGWNRG